MHDTVYCFLLVVVLFAFKTWNEYGLCVSILGVIKTERHLSSYHQEPWERSSNQPTFGLLSSLRNCSRGWRYRITLLGPIEPSPLDKNRHNWYNKRWSPVQYVQSHNHRDSYHQSFISLLLLTTLLHFPLDLWVKWCFYSTWEYQKGGISGWL